jgi:hypothetical protein
MIRPQAKPAGVRDGIELAQHACVRFGVVYVCAAESQVEPGAACPPLCSCFGSPAPRLGEYLNGPDEPVRS